eukprot:CAMPEP_0204351666 /NCGR_PEP_ID=MMETSP0469-20131031/31290_1 /ASSEMBLY_ACC=CAM_ASM_000384 /TAXON_ID=2969 /ORGANISM="Oxyrrhis marina" /LENGTH=171 /DNA_ID=CAMNT_0051338261 /DNA_START=5 /DNA_END=517 /DNA_ORIENTATION=+
MAPDPMRYSALRMAFVLRLHRKVLRVLKKHRHNASSADVTDDESALREMQKLNMAVLRQEMRRKGICEELIRAATTAVSPSSWRVVLDFAKLVNNGTAGVRDIERLASALRIADAWRNSAQFMGLDKADKQAAPDLALHPHLFAPLQDSMSGVVPRESAETGSELFDFFDE